MYSVLYHMLNHWPLHIRKKLSEANPKEFIIAIIAHLTYSVDAGTCQIRTNPSSSPETRRVPSGDQATDSTSRP
jgi:hypothetical protein